MRLWFSFLLLLAVSTLNFAQTFDLEKAPREALGFRFGSTLSDVSRSLETAGLTVRVEPVSPRTGVTRLTLSNQVLGELRNVAVELRFAHDALFQVTATAPYALEAHKALLAVLAGKYGAVRSQDGGYHHSWFFTPRGREAVAGLPEFAISLANDPVTTKTIVLTYVDNVLRGDVSPATEDQGVVPTLNPSQF